MQRERLSVSPPYAPTVSRLSTGSSPAGAHEVYANSSLIPAGWEFLWELTILHSALIRFFPSYPLFLPAAISDKSLPQGRVVWANRPGGLVFVVWPVGLHRQIFAIIIF